MKYTSVSNPRWSNAEHTQIDCDVVFDNFGPTPVPFTSVASGDYPYTHQIFAECASGKYGAIAEYIPPLVPVQG